MRQTCYTCFRPISTCLCKDIIPINTGIKFVVLIHPKEARKQKTGTGRLTTLSLKDSELITGINFAENKRVNELIKNTQYFPVLLYPGKDAFYTDNAQLKIEMKKKKLLVFLIDATWQSARKMMHLSANLQKLLKISFSNNYKSQFSIKKQPKSFCLSTIESVYYLIEELKDTELIDSKVVQHNLFTVFLKMINFQVTCYKDRKASS